MSRFVPVLRVVDVPRHGATAVRIGERAIAIFEVDGAFYAIDDTCPHQGGPLHEGWREGLTVSCPWHAWCFRLTDGKMTLGDFLEGVDVFDVRVEDGTIYVDPQPRA